MSEQRLLSAVIPLFTTQLENVATESLRYILGRSERVKETFTGILSDATGLMLTENLTWRTQVSGEKDSARPDLVGTDATGRVRVIIEAKFWADLTPNQPGTYIERLQSAEQAGAVVVIGPEQRMKTLWAALRQACPPHLALGADHTHHEGGCHSAEVLGSHRLALIGWNAVIKRLLRGAETAHETDVADDLRQLQGLVGRIDETAFLPLRAEELSDRFPMRIRQLKRVITSVLETVEQHRALGVKKGRVTGFADGFGETLLLGTALRGFLCVDFRLWAREGWTPLWFKLFRPDNKKTPKEVFDTLRPLEGGPVCRFFDDYWGPVIPISLPTGEERAVVVAAVAEQVKEIVEMLRPLGTSVLGGPVALIGPDASQVPEAEVPVAEDA
jgi:hypothetical protein